MGIETEAVSAAIGWLVNQEVCHDVVTDSLSILRKTDTNFLKREWVTLFGHEYEGNNEDRLSKTCGFVWK